MNPDTVKSKQSMELLIIRFTRCFFVFLGTFIIYHAVRVSFLVKEELGHNIVPSYFVYVTYRYAVDGKLESSDKMTVDGNEAGDRSEAQSMVSEYPAGSDVTVHYSPTEPSRSVLKTERIEDIFSLLADAD